MTALTLASLTSLTIATNADTVRIPLRKETPAHLIQALPQYGLDKDLQITADARDNTLLVQGAPQSIEALKRIITVRENFVSKQIKLTMQVICVRFAGDGTWEVETIGSPTIITTVGQKALVSQDSRDENSDLTHHLGIEVTPFWKYLDPKNPNGVSVIEMKGMFAVQDSATQFNNAVIIQGRLLPGKKLIVGLTDSSDPQVKALAASGRFPVDVKTPTTAYYLHITPTFVPDKN